jgi:hypothetical protein
MYINYGTQKPRTNLWGIIILPNALCKSKTIRGLR